MRCFGSASTESASAATGPCGCCGVVAAHRVAAGGGGALKMVRLTADLVLCSPQQLNALKDRELDLRGTQNFTEGLTGAVFCYGCLAHDAVGFPLSGL